MEMPARPEVTGRALPSVSDKAVYTVAEFIRAHGISRGKFYDLLRKGQGPRLMRLGTRVLITIESAAEWRAERSIAAE
jgi:hypothetical protein